MKNTSTSPQISQGAGPRSPPPSQPVAAVPFKSDTSTASCNGLIHGKTDRKNLSIKAATSCNNSAIKKR